jgi:hypothetical protein
MVVNIDKKVAGLMIGSLLVGGLIGGAIGVGASHEEGGRGERGNKQMMEQNGYDNQADGEVQDDKGGAPNFDEQGTTTPSVTASTTTVKVK